MTSLLTNNLPLLAGAPNGIKKLRELILELAVRGKLVPQDQSDEPASKLLERIADKKARLVAEGKIKKAKAVDDAVAEISYPIPLTWAAASLGQVVEIVRGITFPASEKSRVPEPGRVACLRTSNVQNEIEWDDLLYIRANFISRPDQYIQPCDIVMSMANSRELVGKVALIGPTLDQPTTFGGFLGVLRPVLIEPRFVMAMLRTPHARSVLIDSASQTTNIANVSLAKLRPLHFAIPPLAEQRRIVAKVDELMTLCDRLEAQQADAESAHAQLVQALLDSLTQASDATDFAANWQRLAEDFHTLFTTVPSIDALKQTLLQLAVMGKIVPQDPSDEPASELLKRIAEEKMRLVADGKIRKQKPLAEIDDTEKSFELPAGWTWQRFADFALDISTGPFGSLIHQSDYVNGGVPLINPSHMIDGGIVADHSVSLSHELAATLDAYRLNSGDMVMARRGEVGRVALVTSNEDGWLCGTGSFVLRFTQEVSRQYIWILFRCNSIRTYLAGAAVGTTMVNLNHGILLKMPTAIPPLAEQYRIVIKVDQLMSLCDQLKTRLTQARQLNEQLASTLVEQVVA